MVGGVDAAFVAADDDDVVAFEVVVAGDGRGVAAEVAAGESAEIRILELAGGPDDMPGAHRPVCRVDAEAVMGPCDREHVGVLADRDLEEVRDGPQIPGVLLTGGMLDLEAVGG